MNEEQQNQNGQVPQHLREGWEVFQAWARARQASGQPLPPGGQFILNKQAILKDAVFILRERLVNELQLPPQFIELQLERDDDGGLTPKVQVRWPNEWLKRFQQPGIKTAPGQSIEDFARSFVQAVLKNQFDGFKAEAEARATILDQPGRDDLAPTEVIDVLDEADSA